jgi:signal transduction histidine kinase
VTVPGPLTPVVTEPSAVLGTVAGLLAEGQDLPAALAALVSGLHLRGAAVRSAAGELLGTAGDVLRDSSDPVVEVPVPVRGHDVGSLTVTGARPSHLSTLRTVASVIGLALGPSGSAALLDAAEAERDAWADALHDGPVQSLLVARLAADLAARGGDTAAAREAVQQALVALRRYLWQVRPRGAAGLGDALAQLSSQRLDSGEPPLALVLDPTAELEGTAAVLAYRVVQAAAGATRVAVRGGATTATVDVDGGTLPDPERWATCARALGGDLFASAGRIRLVLPLTSARTAP